MSSTPMNDTPSTTSVAAAPTKARAKTDGRSREKGKNFTVEEELQLCRSFLAISKDSSKGTNQSADTFHERVRKHFNENLPTGAAPRRIRSVESKWGEINGQCAKFAGHHAAVIDLKISGIDEEEEIQRAMELHAASQKDKRFKRLECWRLLRHEPKWNALRERKTPSTPAVTNGSAAVTADERGVGVKAAKAAAQEQEAQEASHKRLARATVMMAQSSRKRVRALEEANSICEEANNLALFATRLCDLDADAQQFYRMKRAAILAKMKTTPPAEDDAQAAPPEAPTSQTIEVESDSSEDE